MTDHLAALVFGARSVGNHLMFDILRRLGCNSSLTSSDEQRFDTKLPPPSRPIVWGKSLPSNGEWPDVRGMIGAAAAAGYIVQVIAITRGQFPTVCSLLARGFEEDDATACANINTAMHLIYDGYVKAVREDMVDAALVLISYEELVARPVEVTQWLARKLGLRWSPTVASAVRDENTKYWEAWQ